MAILCIDQGNSNLKTGSYTDGKLSDVTVHRTEKKLLEYAGNMLPAHIVLSTVQKKKKKLYAQLKRIAPLTIVHHTVALPVVIRYETPQTLGSDRIAAVVGAHALFKDSACLVIDVGTCITYDYIDRAGVYRGGAISPGLTMRSKAMHKYTSSLPLVAPRKRYDRIGATTRTSMGSGIVHGILHEINGSVDFYCNIDPDIRVLLCGGDAIFFEKKIKGPIFAFPNLVLTGLHKIYGFNVL